MTGTSEHFIENIDKLYRECQQRGIIFVALKQQAKSHLVKEHGYEGRHLCARSSHGKRQIGKRGRAIKVRELHLLAHSTLTTDLEQWATSNHVPFVNVQKVLDQDRDVLMSWVHLSPRGNRMIANALAKEIVPSGRSSHRAPTRV